MNANSKCYTTKMFRGLEQIEEKKFDIMINLTPKGLNLKYLPLARRSGKQLFEELQLKFNGHRKNPESCCLK